MVAKQELLRRVGGIQSRLENLRKRQIERQNRTSIEQQRQAQEKYQAITSPEQASPQAVNQVVSDIQTDLQAKKQQQEELLNNLQQKYDAAPTAELKEEFADKIAVTDKNILAYNKELTKLSSSPTTAIREYYEGKTYANIESQAAIHASNKELLKASKELQAQGYQVEYNPEQVSYWTETPQEKFLVPEKQVYQKFESGEFIDTKTGLGYSSAYDLTKKGFTRQVSILTPKEQFISQGKEISRFEQAGYSPQESVALQQFTSQYQFTPTRETAQNYLRNEREIAPKGFFPKADFYTSLVLKRAGQGLDTGLKKLGIDNQAVLSVQVPSLIGFGFTSPISLEPKALFMARRQVKYPLTPIIPPTNPTATAATSSQVIIPTEKKQQYINIMFGSPQVKVADTTYGKAVTTGLDVGSWLYAPTGIVRSFITVDSVGEKAIRKDYISPEEKIGAGLLVGGAVLGKGYQFLRKPIVKVEKPAAILTAYDVIQPVQAKEEIFEQGQFLLKQTIPERKITQTTRLRNLLGLEPKTIKVIPEKLSYAYTPSPIITKEGEIINNAYVISRKPKSILGTISRISGKQGAIETEEFFKLPKTQQYAFQRLAEIKAGRPVSIEFVPKILGKDFEYSRGMLESVNIAKIYPKKKRLDILPYGKRVSMADVAVVAKEYPSKIKDFQLFKTKTTLKDITKPFARASGKVPEITGFTIIKKPKEILDTSGEVAEILKVSPKSIQTIKKAEALASKTLPKPRTPKIDIAPSKPVAALSIGTLSQMPKVLAKTEQTPREKTVVIDRNIEITKPALREELKFDSIQQLALSTKDIIKERQRTQIREEQKIIQRQPEILKERQNIKQQNILKQFSLQKQRQGLKNQFPKPKIKSPIKKPLSKFSPTSLKKVKELLGGESYEVIKILDKRPVKVTGGVTKEQALDIGAKEVLKDLRATFAIKKSNERLRKIQTFGEFKRYSKLFRKPVASSAYNKVGEEVYVQRKEKVNGLGGRLAFKGEVAEILRKKKKRRLTWF